MRLTRDRFARLMQYVGVAIAAHAVTMHAIVWRYVQNGGDAHPDMAASWVHVSIGVILGTVFFWTGVSLERRSHKPDGRVAWPALERNRRRRMKMLFSSASTPEVGLLKSLLDGAGIASEIRNENTYSNFPGAAFRPELWIINEQDYSTTGEL